MIRGEGIRRFFSRRDQVNIPMQTGERVGVEYAAIPRLEIPALARQYIAALETEESAKWCKCLWRIHPDDVAVKMGTCRVCGGSPKNVAHQGLPKDFELGDPHRFAGVRKKRIDDHPECPVHTREGLLIHFFKWAAER